MGTHRSSSPELTLLTKTDAYLEELSASMDASIGSRADVRHRGEDASEVTLAGKAAGQGNVADGIVSRLE